MSRIKDASLAEKGATRVEWAGRQMDVLRRIKGRFSKELPFKGLTVGACMHVTTETANLMLALKAGGARVVLAASNPLSTQDDVAAYLAAQGVEVYAVRGDSTEEYHANIGEVVKAEPDLIMDDGGDLTVAVHKKGNYGKVRGGTEETTTGVIRLESMAKEGALRFPMVAVNDAMTKQMFDNRYGTGQSTLDGIIRATNVLLAGRSFVVAGYGWCGRGVAMRARGMGANVIVTEVDPVRALEAVMDGFRVMPMEDAAREGDIFVTVTGDRAVIREEHFRLMKDGAMLANAGHFNVEIDAAALRKYPHRKLRDNVEEYEVGGRRLYLLAEGRLVNLAAAEGHPAAVMDMSFANQALAAELLTRKKLEPGVHRVPPDIDREVARLKLESMGVRIDELTEEQRKYLSSWKEGT